MVKKKLTNTGIIILAAGQSARLGSPKQLLPINDKYLLQHILDITSASLAQNVVLVLGAFSDKIRSLVDISNVHAVDNIDWQSGLSTSIICGLDKILHIAPDTDNAIFVLCDQLYTSSAILNEIFKVHRKTGAEIVLSNYGEAFGPPVLFHKNMFPYLKLLKGNEGAKTIIKQFSEKVSEVHFPQGHIDIDTLTDYQNILGQNPLLRM